MTRPVLAVGPLPPPRHGVATAMEHLRSAAAADGLPIVFLDIADRRGLANIGLLEWGNVWLAMRHGAEFLWLLARHRPAVVYLTLAQGTLGFLRDCLFLVPSALTRRRLIATRRRCLAARDHRCR